MTFTIDEIQVPDDPASDLTFKGLRHVRNAVETAMLGSDVFALDAEALAMVMRGRPGRSWRHLVARVGDSIVGRACLKWPTADDAVEVDIEVDVLVKHRGQGIGSALLAEVERWAADLGRTSWQAQQIHTTAATGERLASATGTGSVPLDDAGAQFLVRHGYGLEMVARIGLLDVRAAQVPHPVVPDGYRLVAWSGSTPSERLDDIAALKTAMFTDAPMAGMVVSVDRWDAERLQARDARMAAGGRRILTAAVEHVATGGLVAFTELDAPAAGEGAAHQADTLVVREHRGAGLGLLAKAANLRQLRGVSPATGRLTTFNAEDNVPMITVNDALGFEVIGVEGNWRKTR